MGILRVISTLITVSLVTILIWAFAEAETLRKVQAQGELVFVPDPTSERQLTLKGGGMEILGATQVLHPQVRLEGTAAAVDEAERVLRRRLEFKPYDKSMPITPGENTVDLRTLIRSHSEFQRLGSVIESVEPPTVTIVLEELATREADVRVVLAAGQAEGAPEPKPARVRVRCPVAQLSSLPKDLSVVARIDAAQLDRLIPGRRETVGGVKLTLPEPLDSIKGIRLDPTSIDVQLTLSQRTPTSKPMNVPVQVMLASIEQNTWDITFDARSQFVPDVTVTGPADVVRQIEERKLPVVALLQLSFTELEGAQTLSKEVVFTTMPPTQAPLRFDAPSRIVTFTVKKR